MELCAKIPMKNILMDFTVTVDVIAEQKINGFIYSSLIYFHKLAFYCVMRRSFGVVFGLANSLMLTKLTEEFVL